MVEGAGRLSGLGWLQECVTARNGRDRRWRELQRMGCVGVLAAVKCCIMSSISTQPGIKIHPVPPYPSLASCNPRRDWEAGRVRIASAATLKGTRQ